jgi:hypothetical protein
VESKESEVRGTSKQLGSSSFRQWQEVYLGR